MSIVTCITCDPQGLRLEAEPGAVRCWAASAAAAPAGALADAAARARGPHEGLVEEDADRDARCRRALRAVQVQVLQVESVLGESGDSGLAGAVRR